VSHAIATGDVLASLRDLPDNSFDAALTDPPYGFRFMGKAWDYDVPSVEVWKEMLRVLKPGAPLLSFGGARTFHRIAVGIEDAGFEIRDCLLWLYAKGFPKSLNFGCKCETHSETEHDLRSLSEKNLPSVLLPKDQQGQILQQVVQEQSTSAQGPQIEETSQVRPEQSSLEGRSNVQAKQRKLRRSKVREMSSIVSADGSERRVHNGAPSGHGSNVGTDAVSHGGCASQGPQHSEQRSGELGAVPEQRGAQESGSRCEACGGVVGWDGYGTALKPAYEPIILARKPLQGTMANNVARWGVGGLAIDACRIPGESTRRNNTAEMGSHGGNLAAYYQTGSDDGRWPANVAFDEDAAAILDASAPHTKSVPYRKNTADGAVLRIKERTAGGYAEPASGPSRFFYCSKVSTKEREAGCDALPQKSAGEMTEREDACPTCTGTGWHEPEKPASTGRMVCFSCSGSGRSAGIDNPRAGAGRSGGARNHHVTLKPIALTKWLASLICPPTAGATLLVPYSGAGSEIIGALQAGWPLVFGIEGEAEYIQIAEARIAHWIGKEKAA
jgi:DNA modification methylase